MAKTYEPSRVARLAEISTKFTAHAEVGDEIMLGIEGDDQMPSKYRGGNRPTGVITKIKNAGTTDATLRVKLNSGNTIDLHPYTIDGGRVWEFTDSTWKKVLARNGLNTHGNAQYRGSGDELVALQSQITEMSSKFDRKMAEATQFNDALVESIAQITSEIVQANPQAKFSKTFQEEYRGMRKEPSPFDSDMSDYDD